MAFYRDEFTLANYKVTWLRGKDSKLGLMLCLNKVKLNAPTHLQSILPCKELFSGKINRPNPGWWSNYGVGQINMPFSRSSLSNRKICWCYGRFIRYDFVGCGKLTTGPRHKLFRVNQTYNSFTTVVYVKKMSCRILKHVLKRCDNRSRNR